MTQPVEEIYKAKAYVDSVLSGCRMAGEFGFTSVSRQRMRQGASEGEDTLESLFSGIR